MRNISLLVTGGKTMMTEIILSEPPESKKKLSSLEIPRPTRHTGCENEASSFAWKQTILETSQKQGYTGVAL
jgi:hypothetical protein